MGLNSSEAVNRIAAPEVIVAAGREALHSRDQGGRACRAEEGCWERWGRLVLEQKAWVGWEQVPAWGRGYRATGMGRSRL